MSTEQTPYNPNEVQAGTLAPADDTDVTDPVEGDDPQEESPPMNNVRQLPTHLLPRTSTGRANGRPRKINPKPTANDLEYHAAIADEKKKFITDDPVVRALIGKPDSAQLLSSLRLEIAKEAAALHFTRMEAEKYGKDTAQTSTRRIDALTRIAHIELEIRKLAPDTLDVRGEKFQKVFAMFIQYLKETAQETLTPEAIDMFFNRFTSKMDGWEDKAADITR